MRNNVLIVVALLVASVFATHKSKCGDGVPQSRYFDAATNVYVTEECDDGNKRDNDGCSHLCQIEHCGDHIVQYNEECDGEPLCDMVHFTCKWMRCGNGFLQPDNGEECDDNNRISGDGCSDVCKREYCGDGVLQPNLHVGYGSRYEQCDDGNNDDFDGCDMFCQVEYCGDDVPQPELGEMCDLGLWNVDPEAYEFFPYSWCNTKCQCVGYDPDFKKYATQVGGCPGTPGYSEGVILPGQVCFIPNPWQGEQNFDPFYTLELGQTESLEVLSQPNIAVGSPFFGGWDVDLQGAFNLDFEPETGSYYHFKTAESGVVHITTVFEQNYDPEMNALFLEVYDQPCAAPMNYIASNAGPVFMEDYFSVPMGDLFFYAVADKDYYLFSGMMGMYDAGGDTVHFQANMLLVPAQEIGIPAVGFAAAAVTYTAQDNSVQDEHNFFVVDTPYHEPHYMFSQWFHFVVPDFDMDVEVGTPVCIAVRSGYMGGDDYAFVYLYSADGAVSFASTKEPSLELDGPEEGDLITTSVGAEWYMLVQIPSPWTAVLDSCVNTGEGYQCSEYYQGPEAAFPLTNTVTVGKSTGVGAGAPLGSCYKPK